jgi:rhamnose utilization protein RhaD (predicted bifunctional aldolase and dehydrogenase)
VNIDELVLGAEEGGRVSGLDELVAVSRWAGQDVLLVQGGGGNTSLKTADGTRMWIKGSGLRLSDMRPGYGYVETDLPALQGLLRDPRLRALPPDEAHSAAERAVQAAVRDGGALRPSLETTFHAALDRLVLHTHPVYANAFACLAGGEGLLREAGAERRLGTPVAWVDYATPGYALGAAVADALEGIGDAERPAALILASHGFIAHGQAAGEVLALTDEVVKLGRECFGPLPDEVVEVVEPRAGLDPWAEGLRLALTARGLIAAGAVVRVASFAALNAAADEPERWLCAGPLIPDDVVYAGRRVWTAKADAAPDDWVDMLPDAGELAGRLAVAVVGLGLIVVGPSEGYARAMEENLLAHVLIRRLLAGRGGAAVTLPDDAVEALCAMEAEKYRRQVAAWSPAGRREAGC